ncbi:MAG: tRNA (guanosine(46)-N7)-methyltransferase TrmB [Ruminococcus sp.]|nr:tRNA (guanosine(46)-N7)-methyltransferase TrmB [Ruminococcus sp.]
MRIRRKKWARPELAVCDYYIDSAEEMKGRWHEAFADNSRPLYIELGCGKGGFAAQHALKYPETNIVAADIKADMLAVGRRTVESMFAAAGKSHDNIILLRINISNMTDFFTPADSVDRIYINFCNPWNRPKHNKRRLTHPRQLEQYKTILKKGGEIRFKTDDDTLFEDSVGYFRSCGFEISYITRDLHGEELPDNLVTEHERAFAAEGKKIKYLTARVTESKEGEK